MTASPSRPDPATRPDAATQVLAAPFEDLVDRLDREAAEGLFHTAAQLVVEVAGETVLNLAVGRTHRHFPFRTDTLSALYCTAKPLIAVAVLALVADDELSSPTSCATSCLAWRFRGWRTAPLRRCLPTRRAFTR